MSSKYLALRDLVLEQIGLDLLESTIHGSFRQRPFSLSRSQCTSMTTRKSWSWPRIKP